MSNTWSIAGGQAAFVTTSNTERGLAYNPQTKHVLIVSRAIGLPTSPAIMVLDSATGAVITNLAMTGILTSGTAITFAANLIGIADDGVIYVCNLTSAGTATATNNFVIYRWANENASPTIAFQGQVGALGSRWGDNFDVRGSGVATQMIVGQSDSGTGVKGKSVAIFTSVDGVNFGVTVLDSTNGALSDFNRGLSFGPGNTIYSKSAGATSLKYSVFDLTSMILSNVATYAGFDSSATPLKVDAQRNLLAMLRYSSTASTNQFVSLYWLSGDTSAAPMFQDTKYCTTNLPNSSGLGALCFGDQSMFALNTGNSLLALTVNTLTVAGPPTIVQQPASQYVYRGAPSVKFTVSVTGAVPFSYQWQKDAVNLLGRTNASVVLTNITDDDQGLYQVIVTNSAGSTTSYAVPLMVRSPVQGNVLTNIWELPPLSRPYLSDSDSTQRGLAYSPASKNVLLASRTPTNALVVLDSNDGAQKHFMNVDPSVVVSGSVTYALNTIGVGDDGVVYGVPLVVAGQSASFRLYAWNDDSPTSTPHLAFNGDPGNGSNLRWGDSVAVRGGGASTQLLLGAGSGSSVSILTTSNGLNFNAKVVTISDGNGVAAPSGFAQLSVAWGTGNTFWTKSAGQLLRQVQFDFATGQGTIVNVYDTSQFPTVMTAIAVEPNRQWLAALMFENPDNIQLFDMAEPFGPTMIDQGLFTVKNSNTFSAGVSVFGDNHLFVLNSNNGIKAFSITSDAVLPVFSITGVSINDGLMTLTWQSVPNHSYQVQYKDSLDGSNWSNASATITATNVMTSFSETINTNRFYRVSGQ